MKIRTCFVANSSSSSFIISIPENEIAILKSKSNVVDLDHHYDMSKTSEYYETYYLNHLPKDSEEILQDSIKFYESEYTDNTTNRDMKLYVDRELDIFNEYKECYSYSAAVKSDADITRYYCMKYTLITGMHDHFVNACKTYLDKFNGIFNNNESVKLCIANKDYDGFINTIHKLDSNLRITRNIKRNLSKHFKILFTDNPIYLGWTIEIFNTSIDVHCKEMFNSYIDPTLKDLEHFILNEYWCYFTKCVFRKMRVARDGEGPTRIDNIINSLTKWDNNNGKFFSNSITTNFTLITVFGG